jgi:single-strand DNA-binding protein
MSLLNKVMMIGNLTGDPVVRETGKGTVVASFSMALNHRAARKDGTAAAEETSFVDVVLWDRMAENASEYLRKGSSVLIEGRLQQNRWEDKETGQKRSKLRVVGERMGFMGGGASDSEREADSHRAGRGTADGRAPASNNPRFRRRDYAPAPE